MPRGPQPQFDRDDVLERAMELFWAQGYEGTGMTQLLEHVGIGRQSLYNTFGDKKTLYLEAMALYFRNRRLLAQKILQAPGSHLDNLEKLFHTIFEISAAAGFCGCLVGNSAAELGRRDPEVEHAAANYLESMKEALVHSLRGARDQGELRADLSPEDAAELLLVVAQGVAVTSKCDPDLEKAKRIGTRLIGALRKNPNTKP